MKRVSLRKNFIILVPIVVLLIISLLDMYGAQAISPLYRKNLMKQTLWIIIGVLAMFAIYKTDEKLMRKYSIYFYILGVFSLILVLFFGSNVNGATSWFRIGPFSFQPSELYKFFYIVYLSDFISKKKKKDIKLFIEILFLTTVPILLIFLEPDTGVVLMYMLMFFGIFLESGIPKKYMYTLISLGLVFLISFFSLYFLNGDLFTKIFGTSFFYRIDRLLSFKNASSYQLGNALIGVGASGLFGLGLKSSKIYVPEVTTDFVFDLSIFNFGFIMGIFITALYVVILIYIIDRKNKCKSSFDKMVLSGIFYMMSFQVIEHIFMNLGLFPITGITLPFLSYGGSSLLSYFMLFALILKIKTRKI